VDELATDTFVDNERPWSQGYELAESVLDDLGVFDDSQESVDIDAILASLGVHLESISLQDPSIRGVAIAGAEYRPTILLNRSYRPNARRTARRFSLAHELCHLLYDRGVSREIALPSGPWAPRDIERRANAFAAMLLMPPGRIRSLLETLGDQPGSLATVLDVSQRLQTSFTATAEHMHNLGLISEEERDAILDEAIRPSAND
jgi:Zn-dependent peptidase ImmA (M78 family)